MDSDDAADIVADLPSDVAEKVMEHVSEEVSNELQALLNYEDDTAGGIMALEFIAMLETNTVNETIEKIREVRDDFDEIFNIWVVDEQQRLVGSVSLTELVLAKGYHTLREIMDVDVISVEVGLDQEKVANKFSKYDLVSMPVVDAENRLVGRITVDDIVDVLEEEGAEDIAFLTGAPDEEVMEESTFILSRARLPWLLVAFFGEIIAAFILNSFEATLKQKVMAAFFIPIVMAMGGSTGSQASVIVVRGMATGDIDLSDTRSRLLKEFKIAMVNAFFFSSLMFGLIYFWDGPQFAVILSVSMFVVINNATIVGAMVPMLFKRFNIDPALAATPFVTTSNDIIGLMIYLSITTLSLRYFG
jgi:magnesium transporter